MYWYPLKEAKRLQHARKLGTLCGLEWNEAQKYNSMAKVIRDFNGSLLFAL